jgi:hypothetical protein
MNILFLELFSILLIIFGGLISAIIHVVGKVNLTNLFTSQVKHGASQKKNRFFPTL